MFFTSTTRGFRVWFHVVGTDGLPRSNLLAGDFTATVVNNADTAAYVGTVTQSAQLLGMYRFDVPAAFLTGSGGGVGDYAVSVVVNTFNGPSSGSNIRSTFSRVLSVTSEHFDSISGSIWNTLSASFNAAGSMGRALNLAQATASQTAVDTFVSGVWNAANGTFNTSGTMGALENLVASRATPGDQMALTTSAQGLIVTGVWQVRVNQFTGSVGGSGSTGDTLYSASNIAGAATVDVASVVSGVWNAANATFNTSGTMGWLENRIAGVSTTVLTNLDTTVSSRAIPGDQMALTVAARGLIVTGVWQIPVNQFTGSSGGTGSTGDALYSASNYVLITTPPTVDAITSGVWNAVSGTFNAAGTMGRAVNLAQVSGSSATLTQASLDSVVSGVWNAANGTFNTSGTMGWLENRTAVIATTVITNLDVAISTRAVPGDQMALTTAARGLIVTGVWQIPVNQFTGSIGGSGTTGDSLYSASNFVNITTPPSVDAITTGVWNAVSGTFNTGGTMGRALSLAQVSGATTLTQAGADAVVSGVWNAANGTFNTSGTMGALENLVASRAVPGDQMALTTSAQGLIVTGVWQVSVNQFTGSVGGSGSTGDTLYSASNIGAAATVDVASVVSGVWNAANATFNTTGTMGWLENRTATIATTVLTNLDATVSSRAVPGDQMALTTATRGLIVTGVWQVSVNQFTGSVGGSGTTGDALYSASNFVNVTTPPTVDAITSGVWNASSTTFNVSGTMGRLQNTAAAGGVDYDALVSGVWNAAEATFASSGTMGWLQGKVTTVSSSVERIYDVEYGRWVISGTQQVMYGRNGFEVVRFNLFDGSGSPFVHDSTAVVERVPTGSA